MPLKLEEATDLLRGLKRMYTKVYALVGSQDVESNTLDFLNKQINELQQHIYDIERDAVSRARERE